MAESYQLTFSDEDQKMYGKLDSAIQDLSSAISYGDHILKKGWKAKPWSRGSTYIQQSAFVTAMVTSYGRAFTHSRGWPKLPHDLIEIYSPPEKEMHSYFLKKRNKLYAHSDSDFYGITPWYSKIHSDIHHHPVFEEKHEDILKLQIMCKNMISEIYRRKKIIKSRYIK